MHKLITLITIAISGVASANTTMIGDLSPSADVIVIGEHGRIGHGPIAKKAKMMKLSKKLKQKSKLLSEAVADNYANGYLNAKAKGLFFETKALHKTVKNSGIVLKKKKIKKGLKFVTQDLQALKRVVKRMSNKGKEMSVVKYLTQDVAKTLKKLKKTVSGSGIHDHYDIYDDESSWDVDGIIGL